MLKMRCKLPLSLENHSKISWLKYPYLSSHPQHKIAIKQMKNGGGIFCFELKGGLESGKKISEQFGNAFT